MLFDRFANEGAVRVVVDRLRSSEIRIAEVGKLLEDIALIMVESNHEVIIDPGQRLELDSAGEIIVGIGVPDREQRRDRFDGGMSGAGEKV